MVYAVIKYCLVWGYEKFVYVDIIVLDDKIYFWCNLVVLSENYEKK